MNKSKNSKFWSLLKKMESESLLIDALLAEDAPDDDPGQRAAFLSSLTRRYDRHVQQLREMVLSSRSGG